MKYNDIQVSRFDSFMRKYFGVKNGGALPTMSPEVSPEISLDPQRGERQFPLGWMPASAITFPAAGGAGTYASLLLTPPVGFIVEVQQIVVVSGAAGIVNLGRWGTPGVALTMTTVQGTATNHFVRDTRYRDITPNITIQYGVNNSGTLGNVFQQYAVGTTYQYHDVDVIIHYDPVQAIQGSFAITFQTANAACNLGVNYRFRQLEPGESF